MGTVVMTRLLLCTEKVAANDALRAISIVNSDVLTSVFSHLDRLVYNLGLISECSMVMLVT